jgi:hypothetical protein
VHQAIVYEYAQWRKRSPGSKLLRELLHKVVQHDAEKGMLSWGPLYDGQESDPLSRQEEKWRQEILGWTHTQAYAKRVINNLDSNVPVYTRVSFIEAVAAICALHSKEVDRKVTGMSKPVRQLLWNACSPSRLGWLFNNQRVRHSLAPAERCLLPSGTTSNEALHSEINSWARSTHELITPQHFEVEAASVHIGKAAESLLGFVLPTCAANSRKCFACTRAGSKPLDFGTLAKILLLPR